MGLEGIVEVVNDPNFFSLFNLYTNNSIISSKLPSSSPFDNTGFKILILDMGRKYWLSDIYDR